MDSKSEVTIEDHGAVEVGTVIFNGREFSADGAVVGETLIICYPRSELRGEAIPLTTWNGSTTIMTACVTGTARGFRGCKLYCYSGTYAGYRWHGRGLGRGMVLKMRRGAKV